MKFCPNCGAKKEPKVKVCPYCGYSFTNFYEKVDYERKIEELEHKLTKVEDSSKKDSWGFNFSQMKYFWIIAAIMVLGFFAFIFYFVYLARSH